MNALQLLALEIAKERVAYYATQISYPAHEMASALKLIRQHEPDFQVPVYAASTADKVEARIMQEVPDIAREQDGDYWY